MAAAGASEGIEAHQGAVAGIQQVEPDGLETGGVGHRQAPQHRLAGGHLDQAASAGLVVAPAALAVALA